MSAIKIERGISLQPKNTNQDAKIRDAAKMYEEYFLNEMTKAMRKTISHSELSEPSMAEKIYSEQLDSEYVNSWANKGGVGLADLIYNQLQERFFNQNMQAPKPNGPIELKEGTTLKVEDGQPAGIPVLNSKSSLPTNDVSFLYEWESLGPEQNRNVLSPFSGKVLQSFRSGEDRQFVKIEHDNGLHSTLSFLGQTKGLTNGAAIEAGQKLGELAGYAKGLTWQVGRAET